MNPGLTEIVSLVSEHGLWGHDSWSDCITYLPSDPTESLKLLCEVGCVTDRPPRDSGGGRLAAQPCSGVCARGSREVQKHEPCSGVSPAVR